MPRARAFAVPSKSPHSIHDLPADSPARDAEGRTSTHGDQGVFSLSHRIDDECEAR